MAGGNPKASSHKPSSSSSHRKSRWESGSNPDKKSGDSKPPNSSSTPKTPNNDPKQAPASTSGSSHPKPPADSVPTSAAAPVRPPVAGAPFLPDPTTFGPPPTPQYGFHMLERRTIVLADGSVRSYFALSPDYQDFPPPPPRAMDPAGRFLPMGPGHGPEPVGPGLGRFPPTGPMSPEGFRGERDDPYSRGRHQDYWNSLGLDGRGHPEGSMKRKYSEEDERDRREDRDRRDGNDEFARQRQQLLQYGNPSLNPNGYPLGGDRSEYLAGPSSPFRRGVMDPIRGDELRSSKYMRIGGGYEGFSRQGGVGDNVGLKHHNVDQNALKKAFIQFVKLINESASQRRLYLEDGKQGPLRCLACGRLTVMCEKPEIFFFNTRDMQHFRSSKDFPDMHALVMHTYNSNSDNANLLVDHLGLHKALCVLLGWNYSMPPDNSKTYQFLSADEAAANQDDLIMWPPTVIIHNTVSGKGKDGRMEGLGNKAMDNKLRDLGFGGGKSKSLYGRDGHQGITLVKFSGDQSGLKEAVRLSEFFEKDNHGRKGWARVQPLLPGRDSENNPNLVKVDERTGEKKRIFYGYLATASDLDKVDFETRKKVLIESKREYKPSN